MFSRYRIKEVRGKFIPQKWIFGWYGIDKDSRHLWTTNDNQYNWCGYSTLELAKERIQKYRGYKNEAKYHKI